MDSWDGITGGLRYFEGLDRYVISTGTVPNLGKGYLNTNDFDDEAMDKLVARMMVHTQKVIIPCKWCGSHNAYSNPTCVKCGGPLA